MLNSILQAITDVITGIIHTIGSIITGLISGLFSFILGVLDSLDQVSSILEHGISSITGFFSGFLSLGGTLFPFMPPEWLTIIEAALVICAVGLIIKKKVIG